MSLLKIKKSQIGTSGTATNNFTITAEADNGTMKIARGNAGATTQDILTVDASNNLVLGASSSNFKDYNGNSYAVYTGDKNRIINGNFNIARRNSGTVTATSGSSAVIGVDRWLCAAQGSTFTTTQTLHTVGQTTVTNNPKYKVVNVVTSSAGAGNFARFSQRIENVAESSGETMTLSFWAKANASQNIAVEFVQNFGTGGSPSAEVNSLGVTTCALTTTEQLFTVTLTFPSVSGKTLGSNNNDYYEVIFWMDAGSSFNSRTNSLGQQSGTIHISQVQLEFGSVATCYDSRAWEFEMKLCLRYYQTLLLTNLHARAESTTDLSFHGITFQSPMRVPPTPSITISSVTSGSVATGSLTNTTTVNHASLGWTGGSGFTAGQIVMATLSGNVTLNAEL